MLGLIRKKGYLLKVTNMLMIQILIKKTLTISSKCYTQSISQTHGTVTTTTPEEPAHSSNSLPNLEPSQTAPAEPQPALTEHPTAAERPPHSSQEQEPPTHVPENCDPAVPNPARPPPMELVRVVDCNIHPF